MVKSLDPDHIDPENLAVHILTEAETLSREFGAFGITQNIFDTGRRGQDLETSFWNVTQHMLEILARLRNIKSISGQRVATRHIDYTLAFIRGIISEWTETFQMREDEG